MTMNISPVKVNTNSFKQQTHTFAYDDSVSVERRKYIREHLDSQLFPQYLSYQDRMLSDYELQKLVNTLTSKTTLPQDFISKEDEEGEKLITKLPLYNVCKLPNSHSYRGAVGNLRKEHLPVIKKAGIKRVIALGECRVPIGEFQKNGLEFLEFPIKRSNFYSAAFSSKEDIALRTINETKRLWGYDQDNINREIDFAIEKWNRNKSVFINKFVKFIQFMQQDNVYVGCDLGTWTTDDTLRLNYLFNPKAQNAESYIGQLNSYDAVSYEKLYNNLTEQNKKDIGWDETFEQAFVAKINKAKQNDL